MDDKLGSTEKLWDSFRERMKRNPKKTLFLILLIAVGIIVISILSTIGSSIGSWFSPRLAPTEKSGYQPPPLSIYYHREDKGQQEDKFYKTDFQIFVHQPPGNYDMKFNIITDIPYADCTKPEWKSTKQEAMGAISSTTMRYFVECTSYRQILDTKNMFRVISSS